jgi:hypothetical protein
MSLSYDLTAIADRLENYPSADDRMNPATEVLIFATMAVGIGEITEKNWQQFADRLHIYQALLGRLGHVTDPDGSTRAIGESEVKGHIGLKTNVWPVETDAKWRKRVFGAATERLEYNRRKAAERAEEDVNN